MAEWLNRLIAAIGPWGLPVLVGAATAEYLFPPFPGDTVTIFGAWLAAAGKLHWALVWAAVTLGSGVGLAVDWWVGRWLGRRADRLPTDAERPFWNPLSRERLDRFEARYRRYGDALILANRFLPAVRAFVFLAAGAAEIPLPRVVVLGLVSAGVWNALLLVGGYAVGANLHALERLFSTYSRFAWIALGLAGLALIARVLVVRLRRAR